MCSYISSFNFCFRLILLFDPHNDHDEARSVNSPSNFLTVVGTTLSGTRPYIECYVILEFLELRFDFIINSGRGTSYDACEVKRAYFKIRIDIPRRLRGRIKVNATVSFYGISVCFSNQYCVPLHSMPVFASTLALFVGFANFAYKPASYSEACE